MSEQKTPTLFRCPCGQVVDQAFYPQHIESNHTLHVINISGMNPTLAVGKSPTPMLDIPYIGRVRRDGFLAWTLLFLFIGVLLGARII